MKNQYFSNVIIMFDSKLGYWEGGKTDMESINSKNFNTLLQPKALTGDGIEYTLGEHGLVITNINQMDATKRRIEIQWSMFGRFISELQEIEKIMQETGNRALGHKYQ